MSEQKEETPRRRGCDLGLFIAVNKYLSRRWRGRLCEEQGVNEILNLLGQVEEKFKALPIEKRRRGAGT